MFPDFIYEHSPIWLQNVFCSIKGYMIINERYNDVFYESLACLNKSQFASKQEIEAYKEKHIYEILEYAYKNVPFYKTFYDAHNVKPDIFKSIADLDRFPILTKEIVRKNYKSMLSVTFPHNKMVHGHTSGSTGKSLDFYRPKDMIPYVWAMWWRFREQFGIHFKDKHLNCTGKVVVPFGSIKPPFWRINKPLNQWLIGMQQISNEKIHSIAEMIDRESFKYISGYPSIIYALALCLKENHIEIHNVPKFVFSGAEKMYDNQKALIEEVFPGIICTDHYGMSEGVCNASKCKCGFYHEDYEFGHMECENPHWISDTEYEGNVLGTGFHNFAMPLIRYQIGDTAVWSTKPCECGLHSQVIKDIQGRSEDYVITPEGLRIQRFDYLFKDTRDIKECQVVQYELGRVTFKIVRRESYKLKTEDTIISGVRQYISPTIACDFEYVDEIERTNTGKFRAVISKLK